MNRIAELGKRREIGPDGYYREFLSLIVWMLAARGAAMWTRCKTGVRLVHHIYIDSGWLWESRSQIRHGLLLRTALRTGESMLVAPREDHREKSGGNPTDSVLLLSSIKVEGKVKAVVEVFQRTDADPAVWRAYLRFLVHMCELAGESLALRRADKPPTHERAEKRAWWKFWR